MRVGLIVDGEAEYEGLPRLRDALNDSCGCTVLGPLKPGLQPLAPTGVMAQVCAKAGRVLIAKDVDILVVTFDFETRPGCPARLARNLEGRISRLLPVPTKVVIKNRQFENWLIADLDALDAQPARFDVSRATRRKVEPNKADNINALKLLKQAANGNYHKVRDAVRILDRATPESIGQNSRSFRRFLRVLGHPDYRNQSRSPS